MKMLFSPAGLRAALLIACGFGLFGPTAAKASNEIKILVLEIDGLHQKDGGGIYDRVVKDVVSNAGLKLSITTLPPSRTFDDFESCTDCCITPANKNPEFYSYGAGYVESKPMSVAKIYIWTPPGSAPVRNLATVAGKRVGARRGMPYGQTVESSGLKLRLASSIESNIRQMEAKRLDAFLAYVPDALTAFEGEGVTPFPHAEDAPVTVHPDGLLCKDSRATRAFLSRFDDTLERMDTDGRLATLLGD